MTHQNHQTNGASLEDCHTNFYALTDLCGIKWRKFVNGERPNASSDPLADPILRSYSRCMQADMLCVWRRVQSMKQDNTDPNFEFTTSTKVHPPLSLAAAKELWIFWYGEEPDLSELVDAELLRIAANQALWNGTWKGELTYECRSLLFKALHNLMERFVLTKDIVRFGKWFVQPCTSSDPLFGRSSQHLSFSFTFFVHGDTVCASIDLREHPAVRPLTKEHLAEAAAAFSAATTQSAGSATGQSHNDHNVGGGNVAGTVRPLPPNSPSIEQQGGNNDGKSTSATPSTPPHARKVMLAPFGIAAILTGNSYKANDPMAEKILEDWASFFPLCNKDNSDVPPVVEVVSGGHKMYHPTNYVLVTDLDDMEHFEYTELHRNNTASTAAAATSTTTTTTTTTTTLTATSSEVVASSNVVAQPKDAARKPQLQPQALSALERLTFQPYYDQRPTSGFTFNTNNTHIPPSAAIEMPERAWQDCVTNILHADAIVMSTTSSTTITTTTTGTPSAATTTPSASSTTSVPDDNEQNKPHIGQQPDSKQFVQQQIQQQQQQQQQQQRQKLWHFVDPMQKAPCICTKHLAAVSSTTPHGTPHGGASTYSRNSMGESFMPVASVGSPATPAPSPHPNSAHSQPTSVPPAEQLLNMSPHGPTSVSNLQQPPTPIDHLLDKNTPAPTPTDQHDSKSITASPYVHQSPSVEPPSYNEAVHGSGTAATASTTTTPTTTTSSTQATTASGPGSVPQTAEHGVAANVSGGTPCGTITVKKLEMQPQPSQQLQTQPPNTSMPPNAAAMVDVKQERLPNIATPAPPISTTEVIKNLLKLYKRPQLTLKDSDSFYDEEWLKEVIYDFSFQDSWDYLPVKRPKLTEITKQRRPRYSKNLYEGHTHFKPLMPSPGSVYGAQLLSIDASATAQATAGITGNTHAGLVGIASSGGGGGGNGDNGNGSGTANGNSNDDTENSLSGNYFPGLDIKTEPGLHSPCKESKSTSTGGGNLFTADGLTPSLNDLEQLFETSSNDECSNVQIHTPPDSNNPSNGGCSAVTNTIDELKRSTAVASVVAAAVAAAAAGNAAIAAIQSCGNNGSGSGSGNGTNSCANTIQAEDLTKMFPTPPSHEQQHPNSSPCQTDVVMTDLSVDTTTNTMTLVAPTVAVANATASPIVALGMSAVMVKTKQEYSVELGSPVEEPIDDWSYVYRPPQQAMFVGSSRYAPLTNLPSQTLPPLYVPNGCFYSPTWTTQKSRAAAAKAAAAQKQQQQQKHQRLQQHIQQHQQHQQQQQQQQQQHKHQQLHELLLAGPRTPQQQPRTPLGPMQSPSPMGPNTVPQPLSSGGSNLLLNQLNCPQAALTNTHHLMQRAGMSPISPGVVPFPRSSPMARQPPLPHGGGGHGHAHPPPPYEMAVASPATSTSSYLNKQYNSQEHPHPHTPQSVGGMHHGGMHHGPNSSHVTGGMHGGSGPMMVGGRPMGGGGTAGGSGTGQAMALYSGDAGVAKIYNFLNELPEVNSVLVNVLLYDTSLNVFRDHNFDSSTVCVCNADTQKIGNIRGADSGVYVPLPGSSFNPFPGQSAAVNAATQRLLNGGPGGNSVFSSTTTNNNNHNNNNALCSSSSSFGAGLRMISAFGSVGGPLDSPASLPGAGSGHAGSNSSSCTPPSNNPHITGYVDDDPVECTCGFSAVVNRHLSYRAGLFYEDELEITGIAQDPGRNKQPTLLNLIQSLCRASQAKAAAAAVASAATTPIPATESSSALEKAAVVAGGAIEQLAHVIFDLLLDQCSIIQTSSSSVHRALQSHRRRMSRQTRIFGNSGAPTASISSTANVLEVMDAHDVITLALEQARLAFENQREDVMEFGSSSHNQQQQQHHHHHQQHPHHSSHQQQQQQQQQQQNMLSAFQAAPPALRHKLQLLGSSRLTVHKWPYLPVGFTRSNKEIVRTMNSIQPMLQNAFHSKSRGGAAGSKDASSYNTVSGPLTWRQFHRLAGRASGQCEPQPIPSVIVGYEKDWISVAPHSIHYWDKFLLEPYSYARDVVYLVVCPDNEHVLGATRNYFRELSSTYEMCKLGRHTPIRGWDGILTVGPRNAAATTTATTTSNTTSSNTNNTPNTTTTTVPEPQATPLEDWLRTLEHGQLAEQIRRYAAAFLYQLAPYLGRVPGDKSLLNPPDPTNSSQRGHSSGGTNTNNNTNSSSSSSGNSNSNSNNNNNNIGGVGGVECGEVQIKVEPGTVEPPTSGSGDNANSTDNKADAKSGGDTKPALVLGDPLGVGETLEDINPPSIVLYVVNPFTFATDCGELERLSLIALLRCYAELLKLLPDSVRANMNIQIISLEAIMELGPCGNRKRFSDEIKCLALNIFSQCRRHLVHAQSVKSLTGFGTAANMEAFLKTKDEQNRRAYKMYTAPFVLAPMHERNDKTDFSRAAGSMHGQNEHRYSVMYCNYCLSEDQSWLLATATDDRGELLEKVCINIDVPNRSRRRKAPARYVALKKLMDFIMGLISQTSQMWRLVIGRIGRIGHSELKSWSYLLSKQQLQKASKQFKDMCKQCTLMYPPTILSACLVTLEPDAKLRVMPDQFTPDERFSQISMQNPLSTPQDVTCTHILVFPTSAVCASFTRQFQNEPPVDDDFLTFEEEGNEEFSDAELGELFWGTHIDRGSNHGSPSRMEDNRSWPSASGNNFKCTPPQEVEEVGSLNQQPISVGYMVSTAPTGRMPAWFWSACPHLEDVCPVFLKTALHLHVPNIQTTDDILNSTNAHQSANDHPLDSTLTADVLRFVLEGYNALSWLALDSNTHDRLSCLPINVQTLMDLYYLTAAIA